MIVPQTMRPCQCARHLAVQTWLDLRCATCVSHADINSFSSDVADSWRAPAPIRFVHDVPTCGSATSPPHRMRSRANAAPLTREARQMH